jgi:hypothetical protein
LISRNSKRGKTRWRSKKGIILEVRSYWAAMVEVLSFFRAAREKGKGGC